MAPRSRSIRPTQNGPPKGMELTNGNHQPPRSTIAAQIVHNRANVARQEPENKALFGKLLQEYLRDPIIEDANVETNAQLIQVVAEAGLDVLLSDDPFAPANLLEQAKDSLMVIRLTVTRDSNVLLFPGDSQDTKPPFVLWILAKMLKLLGRRTLMTIEADVCSTITTLLVTLAGKHKFLSIAESLYAMLQQLVEDILATLGNYSAGDARASSNFHTTVPAPNTIALVWPNAPSLLVLPSGYQADIRDATQAMILAVRLLAALHDLPRQSGCVANIERCDESWFFECCYQVQDLCLGGRVKNDDDIDRVFLSMAAFLRQFTHDQCLKRKIEPMVDLIASLIDSLDLFKHSEALEGLMNVVEVLTEIFLENNKRAVYLRRELLPVLRAQTVRPDSGAQPTFSAIQRAIGRLVAQEPDSNPMNDERPSKRIRIAASAFESLGSYHHEGAKLMESVSVRLTGVPEVDFWPSLNPEHMEYFASREDNDKISIIRDVGSMACIFSRAGAFHGATDISPCELCDAADVHQDVRIDLKARYNNAYPDLRADLMEFLSECGKDDRICRSKACRVALADTIRKVANHSMNEEHMLLDWENNGTWLMRSLQSSAREIRLAAAEALVAYVDEGLPEVVRLQNRMPVIDFLRLLAQKDILHVQETLASLWGFIGRRCGEKELNLALMQLVDFLGHSHSLISGSAYHEILQLAESRGCTAADLLRPFWRSLAVPVINDIYACPQRIQQLADLLSMSVNELLIQTQADTIPFLILTKRRDVLQRIAQARGPSIDVHDLWLQPARNLGAVLAKLLVQPSDDPEAAAIALLKEASPSFGEQDLSNLVRIEPTITACEILKYAADYEDNCEHAQRGLRLLAVINERKSGSSRSSKSTKTLGSFLEAHVLGIMSHFTDIIDSPLERQSTSEKKRALRAIEQLFKCGDSRVSIAIPQIRATLQSASKIPALADVAFITWSALVGAAGEEDIKPLIDQTFAFIAHHWASFSGKTQQCAHETITNLLKNHNAIIRDRIQMLPSLAGIEMLSKFESEIKRLKAPLDPMVHLDAYARRCADENAIIVHRALLDLLPFLDAEQIVIHASAVSQHPSPTIANLLRALLDAVVRFREHDAAVPGLVAKCIGAIGCIDPNKVDETRPRHDLLMLSNFAKAEEVIDFAIDILERVLVDAFHAAPTGRVQTYLAYAMQELLKFCGFRPVLYKARSSQSNPLYNRWMQIPETTRNTLMPFFNTRYALVHPSVPGGIHSFPILKPGITHATWLRTFVFNLLHQATTENTQMIFPVLSRIIWGHDISIPTYLLPFVTLNIIVAGNDDDTKAITAEFLRVLSIDIDNLDDAVASEIKHCSENIFQVLDYLSRWLQAKKKQLLEYSSHNRNVHDPEFNEITEMQHISSVDTLLSNMPADIISRRAVHCRSFARAILHWEQHIRQTLDIAAKRFQDVDMEADFRQLQSIYAQIDEPDAVEGISTRLHILDPEQQILEHKRAGRWTAAQSWYELSLAEAPDDRDLQIKLLTCLKASNRFGTLLDFAQSLSIDYPASVAQTVPFAAEAAWTTGRWDTLSRFLATDAGCANHDFDTEVGRLFLSLQAKDSARFNTLLTSMRDNIACGISSSTTTSLAAAHPLTIKLHALYELEQIGAVEAPNLSVDQLVERMDKRLDILGALTADKQYLLGIRRAAMQLSRLDFSKQQIGANWLASARLARNTGLREAAYDAVSRATSLNAGAAMIEHSRLLWQDGHHRKAIQNLQGAIESNVFQSYTVSMLEGQTTTDGDAVAKNQNFLLAKTRLTLAKWMDKAGHSKSEELRAQFLAACKAFNRWEKGHYYMGKHYLKIFDSEKASPRGKQSDVYLTGDIQKLVIENFMRSMVFGAKYLYETVPKMLTLWLDLAADIHKAEQNPKALDQQNHAARVRKLETVHKQVKKYIIERLPAYIFYTALPQVTSRINHAQPKANETLLELITKIVRNHPQQALWTILAVAKSRASDKSAKATIVLNTIRRYKPDGSGIDMKQLIQHGEKLTNALLSACEVNVESRASRASLQRDLGFPHNKLAPCQLVVPVEKALSANLPTGMGGPTIRNHRAFARLPITISSFQDDVLVLSSLQRPKKLTMRGSDGELYGLLCKPKDDLRKDQRLMEFTTMIDRGLKRDVESSKRRLYIHTYAVVPLNEECGAIEWVDGLKPMRDIILANFKTKGLRPDYGEIRQLLDKACADPENGSYRIFTDQIITKFPAVLHEWFTDTFPEPDSWFTARLRYTRSCAVMSMVGNALGLGDRHGENILLEEGNGGCFHVDFNCLFDKGLTFEKPELVPFRLTHNVIDAFGVYGYEGPFRTAAELTLKTLKQYEDTLMTIMETFVYDPTTDFVQKPRKRVANVPETPAEVLESVKAKINRLLPGETVPLSVDGYADALIKMAIDPRRLSGMYIGWCAFF